MNFKKTPGMKRTSKPRTKPMPNSYVSHLHILIDSDEKRPLDFQGLTQRVQGEDYPLLVPTTTKHFGDFRGDYALAGYFDQFRIERKSLEDLYGSLAGGRERLKKTVANFDQLPYGGAVVIEGTFDDIINHPPEMSDLAVKSALHTPLSWRFRYPCVHWYHVPTYFVRDGVRVEDRSTVNAVVYGILAMFHKTFTDDEKARKK